MFEKLAKKIVKQVAEDYDDDVSVDDVMEWFEGCDEDDLVAEPVETLTEWFMETH